MAKTRLPRQAKVHLIMLLALGGTAGALAGLVRVRSVQLALVGLAVCLGVYAGMIIRNALFSKRQTLERNEPFNR